MSVVLTFRQARILKHIIEEYVVTAQPVASETLVRKYEPAVSSATVRNEMAALQEGGFLQHPHASAGRVPSDVGYRHYVEHLMGDARLSQTEERTISHQFHQVEWDVEEWMRLAAAVLSSCIQTPVLLVPPVAQVTRLRRMELVTMAAATVLVVAIFRSGAVRQQLVRLREAVAQEALDDLAVQWNQEIVDKSVDEIRELPRSLAPEPLLDAAARLLEEEDRRQTVGAHIEGLSYMAGQPEFGTSGRLQPIVELLERPGSLDVLIEPLFQGLGVRVSIGHEQPVEELRECSSVLSTYGRPGDLVGVVGVIGPTRLPYWRAVPLVHYVAGMLDRLLEETLLLE